MRPSKNTESPPGRPNMLYYVPQSSNVQDYLIPVGLDEIDIAEGECAEEPNSFGCSPHFKDLARMIMEDEKLQPPTNAEEAEDLYKSILSHIEML